MTTAEIKITEASNGYIINDGELLNVVDGNSKNNVKFAEQIGAIIADYIKSEMNVSLVNTVKLEIKITPHDEGDIQASADDCRGTEENQD